MKKITRRSVLRLSGLAAASLALTSCRAAGSAAVGSRFSDWLRQKLANSSSSASSEAAASGEAAVSYTHLTLPTTPYV